MRRQRESMWTSESSIDCESEQRPMTVNLIFARAANGVIGVKGTLPWHLPEDLAHFRRTTMGAPVIMGRKSWDSLPAKFRPLPGRTNIVVTRQPDWQEAGAHRAGSLEEAIALCGQNADIWVIGGAQIYAEAAPLATRAVVTEIDRDFEGDVHAPELGANWHEVAREPGVSVNGLPFSFVTLQRNNAT